MAEAQAPQHAALDRERQAVAARDHGQGRALAMERVMAASRAGGRAGCRAGAGYRESALSKDQAEPCRISPGAGFPMKA
jgi:hypothetical protein